jgi:hypothetical protein
MGLFESWGNQSPEQYEDFDTLVTDFQKRAELLFFDTHDRNLNTQLLEELRDQHGPMISVDDIRQALLNQPPQLPRGYPQETMLKPLLNPDEADKIYAELLKLHQQLQRQHRQQWEIYSNQLIDPAQGTDPDLAAYYQSLFARLNNF